MGHPTRETFQGPTAGCPLHGRSREIPGSPCWPISALAPPSEPAGPQLGAGACRPLPAREAGAPAPGRLAAFAALLRLGASREHSHHCVTRQAPRGRAAGLRAHREGARVVLGQVMRRGQPGSEELRDPPLCVRADTTSSPEVCTLLWRTVWGFAGSRALRGVLHARSGWKAAGAPGDRWGEVFGAGKVATSTAEAVSPRCGGGRE